MVKTVKKKFLLVFIFLLHCIYTIAKENSFVRYEENKGQWESNIFFAADFYGGRAYLESTGVTYQFYSDEWMRWRRHKNYEKEKAPENKTLLHVVKQKLINANPNPEKFKENKLDAFSNYLLGNNPAKWANNVYAYGGIRYKNIYPGIDIEYTSRHNNPEYNYIIKPGANISSINEYFEGAELIKVDATHAIIKTDVGNIEWSLPECHQTINGKTRNVLCEIEVLNNTIKYNIIGNFDKNFDLVIDPILVAASYTGTVVHNDGWCAAYDFAGNPFLGGDCFKPGYIVTPGAFQTSSYDTTSSTNSIINQDMVVTKFNGDASNVLYATYIGGNGNEQPYSLMCDEAGRLTIFGHTESTNFPVTTTGYDTSYNGEGDIFVLKLNETGTALVGSTYIGGTKLDAKNTSGLQLANFGDQNRGAVILDNAGNVYVGSYTESDDFPTTSGSFQSAKPVYTGAVGVGHPDGVVLKLNDDLTTLIWSSYFGGDNHDAVFGITLDYVTNDVIITGGTKSNNIPGMNGYKPTFQGGITDAFLGRINNDGSTLLAATYLGTGNKELGYFVQTDDSSNVYIFGSTTGTYPIDSTNFSVYHTATGTQFIHKLKPDLASSIFSTVIGSGSAAPDISPTGFLVDTCENIYIAGFGGRYFNTTTTMGDLPITANAFQSSTDKSDFYFAQLSKDAARLKFASFFGGPASYEHIDGGSSRFDKNGIIYQGVCAGCEGQSDLPTTSNAWSNTNNAAGLIVNCNQAIIKFDFNTIPPKDLITISDPNHCAPLDVNFTSITTSYTDVIWYFGDGDTSGALTTTHTYNVPGAYQVMLIAHDPNSCRSADTIITTIDVFESPQISAVSDTLVCIGQSYQLSATGSETNYTWSPAIGLNNPYINNPLALSDSSLQYVVTTYKDFCSASDTVNMLVSFPKPHFTFSTSIPACNEDTVIIKLNQEFPVYTWLDNGSHDSVFFAFATGYYPITVEDTNGCYNTDSAYVQMNPEIIYSRSNDTLVCLGDTTHLKAIGNYIYLWKEGGTQLSNSAQLDFIPSQNTTILLTISDGDCFKYDSIRVIVKKNEIEIEVLPNDTICPNEQFTLSAGSLTQNSYQWSNGLNDGVIFVSDTGLYSLSVTDQFKCKASDSVRVFYYEAVLPLANDTVLCAGDSVKLSATGGNSYTWSPPIYLSDANSANPFCFAPANTSYQLIAESNGCIGRDSIFVTVLPYPVITLSDTSELIAGQQLQLSLETNGNYTWSPMSLLSCTDCLNPFVYSDTSTWVYIRSQANGSNCVAYDSIYIKVKEIPGIYVPSAFTPNNDGLNDVFKIITIAMKEISITIYDRWGNKIAAWKDENGFWDGTIKGVKAIQDVYIYSLTTTDINNKTYTKTGRIALIR